MISASRNLITSSVPGVKQLSNVLSKIAKNDLEICFSSLAVNEREDHWLLKNYRPVQTDFVSSVMMVNLYSPWIAVVISYVKVGKSLLLRVPKDNIFIQSFANVWLSHNIHVFQECQCRKVRFNEILTDWNGWEFVLRSDFNFSISLTDLYEIHRVYIRSKGS